MKKILLGLILLTGNFVFAHGGDKPGPHGGFVEMPGAFHTEVVPDNSGAFKVYLIDINFQNPMVENSNVQAWLLNGKKKANLKCEVMGADYFHCMPTQNSFKAKELIIQAKRGEMQGNEARYKLPLTLKK